MAIYLFVLTFCFSWSNLEATYLPIIPSLINTVTETKPTQLGNNITLTCEADNLIEPFYIGWIYEKKGITIAIGSVKTITCDRYALDVEGSRSSLIISNLKASDKGKYKCILIFDDPQQELWVASSYSSFDIIFVPWKINQWSIRKNLDEETLTLTCEAENLYSFEIGFTMTDKDGRNKKIINIGTSISGNLGLVVNTITVPSEDYGNPKISVVIKNDDVALLVSQYNFICEIFKDVNAEDFSEPEEQTEEWECENSYSEFGEEIESSDEEIESSDNVEENQNCLDPYNMTCFSYRKFMANYSIRYDVERDDDYALLNNLITELKNELTEDDLDSKKLLKMFYQKCLKQTIQEEPLVLAVGHKGASPKHAPFPKPRISKPNVRIKPSVRIGSSRKPSGGGGGGDKSHSGEHDAPKLWTKGKDRFKVPNFKITPSSLPTYYDYSEEDQTINPRPNRLINMTRDFFDTEEQSLDDMRELNTKLGLLPFFSTPSTTGRPQFDFSKVLLYLSQLDIQPLLRIETKTNPVDATKMDIYIMPGHLLLGEAELYNTKLNSMKYLAQRIKYNLYIRDVYRVYSKIIGNEEVIADYGDNHLHEESKLAQFWLDNLAFDSSFQKRNISELNEVLGFHSSPPNSTNIEINWKRFLFSLIPPYTGDEYDNGTEVYVSSALFSSSQTTGDFVRNMTHLDHYLSLHWTTEIGMELSSELRDAYWKLSERPNHFHSKEIHCVNLAANLMDVSMHKFFNDINNSTILNYTLTKNRVKNIAEFSTTLFRNLINGIKLEEQTKQHLEQKLSSIHWDISPREYQYRLEYRSYYYEDFAPALPEGVIGVNFVTELAESTYMKMVEGLRFTRRKRELFNFTNSLGYSRYSGYAPLSSEVHYDVFAKTIQISTGVFYSYEFGVIRNEMKLLDLQLPFVELFAIVGPKILKALLKYLMHGIDFESKYDIFDLIEWNLNTSEQMNCFQRIETDDDHFEFTEYSHHRNILITENVLLKLAYLNYKLWFDENTPTSNISDSNIDHAPLHQMFFRLYGKTKCVMQLMEDRYFNEFNHRTPPRVIVRNSFRRSKDFQSSFSCVENAESYYYTCNSNVTYNLANWHNGLVLQLFPQN